MLKDPRWEKKEAELLDPYLSARNLDITEVERAALIEVLDRLKDGRIKDFTSKAKDRLYMPHYCHQHDECGTVACVGGWAYLISGGKAFPCLWSSIIWGKTSLDGVPLHVAANFMGEPVPCRPRRHLADYPVQLLYLFSGERRSVKQVADRLERYLTTGSVR